MAKKNRPLGGLFLSTPSARRATLPRAIIERRIAISIHALREEGDIFTISYLFAFRHFYPRPPRGGRRAGHVQVIKAKVFLSTPSARRATSLNTVSRLISMISIHALREEGDQKTRIASGPRGRFLSTPSARRATAKVKPGVQHGVISIHALREEGDRLKPDYFSTTFDFYPRPPRGGRPPAWQCFLWSKCISIHALREEGDLSLQIKITFPTKFLSTPSARRAT